MDDKNYSISVIRLISMLMIILCHILQGLHNNWAFWVNVGVQIFLFISGYLYGKKEIKNIADFYKKQIKKIMVPYIIVLTICLFLESIILKNNYSFGNILGCFLGFCGFSGNISILSHTWFVSYILICYMLIPILQNIFKQKEFKKNFLFFILTVMLIQILRIYSVINIEVSWINNFIIGYFYSRCCKEKRQEKFFVLLVIILFSIILPIAIIYQENLNITLPSFLNSNSNIIVNYGHVMLGTVLFIVLYKVLSKCKIKKNAILTFSDKYSYYIYLVHQIFILGSFSILFLTKYLFINILLIFIFTIFTAIIVKKLGDLLVIIMQRILYKINTIKK